VSGTGRPGSPDSPGPGESGESVSAAEAEAAVAGFRATRRGVSARFTAAQAGIIRTLVRQVADLLGPDFPGGDLAHGDPARGDPARGGPADGGPADGGPAGGASPGDSGEDPFGRSWDSPDEFAALLGLSESTALPEDPVLARLLPDAYPDDAGAAGDFRRYTEQDLRSGKVAAARTVLATLPESGGQVLLAADDAQAWLRAINDVRLALGVRLSITEDFEQRLGQLDPQDPRSAYFWVYDWLTYLQETLVHALW
jgi:hypothetical protein